MSQSSHLTKINKFNKNNIWNNNKRVNKTKISNFKIFWQVLLINKDKELQVLKNLILTLTNQI